MAETIGIYNYPGHTLQEKYGWMQQGKGVAAAEAAAEGLGKMAPEFVESSDIVQHGLRKIGVNWTGLAASAAAGDLQEVARWAASNGQASQSGGAQVQRYGTSFAEAKAKVAKPVEVGENSWWGRQADVLGQALDQSFGSTFGVQSDYAKRVAAYRAADEAANAALRAHEQNAREALASFPDVQTMPAPAGGGGPGSSPGHPASLPAGTLASGSPGVGIAGSPGTGSGSPGTGVGGGLGDGGTMSGSGAGGVPRSPEPPPATHTAGWQPNTPAPGTPTPGAPAPGMQAPGGAASGGVPTASPDGGASGVTPPVVGPVSAGRGGWRAPGAVGPNLGGAGAGGGYGAPLPSRGGSGPVDPGGRLGTFGMQTAEFGPAAAGRTAGIGGLPPPMMGGAGLAGVEREHRNNVFIPSDEPFVVEHGDDVVPPVLGQPGHQS